MESWEYGSWKMVTLVSLGRQCLLCRISRRGGRRTAGASACSSVCAVARSFIFTRRWRQSQFGHEWIRRGAFRRSHIFALSFILNVANRRASVFQEIVKQACTTQSFVARFDGGRWWGMDCRYSQGGKARQKQRSTSKGYWWYRCRKTIGGFLIGSVCRRITSGRLMRSKSPHFPPFIADNPEKNKCCRKYAQHCYHDSSSYAKQDKSMHVLVTWVQGHPRFLWRHQT